MKWITRRNIRAADVKGQESVAPEGSGLRAIAEGFAAMNLSDEERLARLEGYRCVCPAACW